MIKLYLGPIPNQKISNRTWPPFHLHLHDKTNSCKNLSGKWGVSSRIHWEPPMICLPCLRLSLDFFQLYVKLPMPSYTLTVQHGVRVPWLGGGNRYGKPKGFFGWGRRRKKRKGFSLLGVFAWNESCSCFITRIEMRIESSA